MKCANHPDREASAFCQNCGKPLCTQCVRSVGTSVLCEPCYELRAAGATPPGSRDAPPPTAGASPALAALLGFIPGVGAMYNGQYAKGVVHLAVFAILISLADQTSLFGLFVVGWIFYMVLEAYHTARARRDGTPLPNPFGLNELGERLGFGRAVSSAGPAAWPPSAPYAAPAAGPVPTAATSGGAGAGSQPPYSHGYAYSAPGSNWGAPQEGYAPVPPMTDVPAPPPPGPAYAASRRFPMGAVWLIALGVIFLLGNMGLFWIRARFVGPLLLIALAIWTFVRRMTADGHSFANDRTPAYSARLGRALAGSIWLAGTGFMWLFDTLGVLPWSRSWPFFLILAGVAMTLRRTLGAPAYPGPYGSSPESPQPPAPTPPSAPGTAMMSTGTEPGSYTGGEFGPREER